MALLFVDGFDHYSSVTTPKWNFYSAVSGDDGNSATILTTSGRRGGGCLRVAQGGLVPAQSYATKNLTGTTNSMVVGMAYKPLVLPSGGSGASTMLTIASFLDPAGVAQCSLQLTPAGLLQIVRGAPSSTTVLATSTIGITANVFTYIEWKLVVGSGTSGSSSIRIDGSVTDALTLTGANTQASTTSSNIGALRLGFSPTVGSNRREQYYDDLYLLDLSGSVNNNFLGDVRIDTIYPDADGTYTDGVPSTGTDHYACVDEATTPSTADFISLSGVGSKDSYSLQNVPSLSSQVIHGVQTNILATKDSGTVTGAMFLRSGTSEVEGATLDIPTSTTYINSVLSTDPNTSSAWTQAAINAMEIGIIVKS